MLTGIYAARNITGERYDVWAVNTEMEYHEEGRTAEPTVGDRLVPTRVVERPLSPDEVIAAAFAKLDPLALGVAVGLVSGLGLFLATTVLLLKGKLVVGLTLSLLDHYLWGFEVTWAGAFVGLVEAGAGGFILGCCGAWLRNWSMTAYASLVRRQAQAQEQRDLLDKV